MHYVSKLKKRYSLFDFNIFIKLSVKLLTKRIDKIASGIIKNINTLYFFVPELQFDIPAHLIIGDCQRWIVLFLSVPTIV